MSKVSPKSPRTPIKQKRSKPRRGPMRDAKYRKWLAEEICAVEAILTEPDCVYVGRAADPAHTENNGMRSKGPDSSCASLCRKHHEEYDSGREAFERKYGLNMKAIGAMQYTAYLKAHGLVRKSD